LTQLGSLGGGNHFIAVNQSSNGEIWLTVHSGSRNFGLTVAKYHQDIAKKAGKTLPKDYEAQIAKIVREGHERTIEKRIRAYKESFEGGRVPVGMEYLSGMQAENYYRDMQVAQWFAKINRKIMLNRIIEKMSLWKMKFPWSFTETIHNYIDFNDRIIRKGAVRAHEGDYLVIPLSMKDGVLFCKGKGNPDWNQSAPHGAGRLMSRTKAKADLTIEEYKRQMREAGVWSSCIGKATLDESPMAYKDPAEIKRAIGDTVEIIDHWSEAYNFKAQE
jgi:RNA-splicing ligase RtcB